MVPHPYGPAFNCVRDHALVESAARCSRSRVADWILRDRVPASWGLFLASDCAAYRHFPSAS